MSVDRSIRAFIEPDHEYDDFDDALDHLGASEARGRTERPGVREVRARTDRGTARVPFQPIGLGKPLAVFIHSIYVGQRRDEDDLLVTSAVKNPVLDPAGVVGMNYLFSKVRSRSEPLLTTADRGNNVVYYTRSLSERKINISVKLNFDSFDRGAAERFISITEGAASLPAFLAGGALAGLGAASSQALVKVGSAVARAVVRVIDNVIDANKMVHLSAAIAVEDPGSDRAKPGYIALIPRYWPLRDEFDRGWRWSDEPDDDDSGDRIDHSRFGIDKNGVLHELGQEGPYRGDFPYVVLKFDGTRYLELNKWKPAAVTAALASRFINRNKEEDVDAEITSAFEAFSDYQLIRSAHDLDEESKDPDLTAAEKAELTARRDALLKEVQDPVLKEKTAPEK